MSEMTENLVSTIIPVHNRAAMLQEAVASVLAQTYRPIEIIIVDDGSTDDTVAVCDELAAQNTEIRIIHKPQGGPGLAREAGRKAARGEFIQYLDSDDLLLPKKFERQVYGLRAHTECGIAYGKTRFCDTDQPVNEIAWKRTGEKIESMFPSFLAQRWWGTSTPLYRKSLLDIAGPWTALCSEEDWEYDCRIAANGVLLHFVPEFVSAERNHSGERLSRDGSTSLSKLSDRAEAHRLIFEHARRAGLEESIAEMQHFARELFLLSRQCGAAGLVKQSRDLFNLARAASGENRARGWDFRFYRLLAALVGWSSLGKLARYSDGFRK